MIEGEAQAWTERLTRIWNPAIVMDWVPSVNEDVLYYAYLKDGVLLRIYASGEIGLSFHNEQREEFGCLFAYPDGEMASHATEQQYQELVAGLVAHWLLPFRRGLWLSGLPIEASAHEKAEWIQGFTREELQAWNLKM